MHINSKVAVLGLVCAVGLSSVSAFAQTANPPLFGGSLQKGQSGDRVKELQHVLSSDPEIYPEGLTTGYFGELTERAVKRLQERYALPVTGTVDAGTEAVILPREQLTLSFPNGGETWQTGSAVNISWEWSVTVPTPYPLPYPRPMPPSEEYGSPSVPSEADSDEAINGQQGGGAVIQRDQKISAGNQGYFFPMATLELIRDSIPSFRYRIGLANLNKGVFAWTIPLSIPAGSDYRVRISMGQQTLCEYEVLKEETGTSGGGNAPLHDVPDVRKCDSSPVYLTGDISDAPFSIVAGTIPVPPPIDPGTIERLKAAVNGMQRTIDSLMREIVEIRGLLEKLQ